MGITGEESKEEDLEGKVLRVLQAGHLFPETLAYLLGEDYDKVSTECQRLSREGKIYDLGDRLYSIESQISYPNVSSAGWPTGVGH